MKYYYLHEDNTAQGPHTGNELIFMLSKGEITLNTLIAEEGGEKVKIEVEGFNGKTVYVP